MDSQLLADLLASIGQPKTAGDILAPALAVVGVPQTYPIGGAFLPHGEALELAAPCGLRPDDVARLQDPKAEHDLRFLHSYKPRAWPRESVASLGVTAVSEMLAALGLEALLLVPLPLVEGWGYLFACCPDRIVLSRQDQDFLGAVGQVVGMALANLDLRLALARRSQESHALREVGRALVAASDLDALLHLVVHSAVAAIPNASNGALYLGENEQERHPVGGLPAIGYGREIMAHRLLQLSKPIIFLALKTGKVIHIPNVSQDVRLDHEPGDASPSASLLVAPLKVNEQPLGALVVDSRHMDAFSPDDEVLAETLAAQAALALETARLNRCLEALYQGRSREDEFAITASILASVAHEMRNPLTAVIGYVQLLQDAEGLPGTIGKDLERIMSQAQKAAGIVKQLSAFARHSKAERELIDVNEMLDQMLALYAYQFRFQNVMLEKDLAEGPLYAMINLGQLQRVFLCLSTHVRDVHEGSGSILQVASRAHAGNIRVTFTSRCPDARTASGARSESLAPPGLSLQGSIGLSLCAEMAQQLGGRLWREESDSGTCSWVVEVPSGQVPGG